MKSSIMRSRCVRWVTPLMSPGARASTQTGFASSTTDRHGLLVFGMFPRAPDPKAGLAHRDAQGLRDAAEQHRRSCIYTPVHEDVLCDCRRLPMAPEVAPAPPSGDCWPRRAREPC